MSMILHPFVHTWILICFAGNSLWLIPFRDCLAFYSKILFKISSLAVKARCGPMQRHIVRRLSVIGAELGNVERLVIIGGDQILSVFDRFTQSIGQVVAHVGAHD